jgi:hypothetical protein
MTDPFLTEFIFLALIEVNSVVKGSGCEPLEFQSRKWLFSLSYVSP